jgi:hypothetical protein
MNVAGIDIWWIVAGLIAASLFSVAISGDAIAAIWVRWVCMALFMVPIFGMILVAGPGVQIGVSRVALSLLVGGITGVFLLTGALELLHSKAEAQVTQRTVPASPAPSLTRSGNITTNNQSGGVNNTGSLTINQEDKSIKRRMHDLLNLVDPRILAEVAQGKEQLKVRMQPFEFDRLQTLIAEDKSVSPVTILETGPIVHGNTINNGSLGTTQSVDQRTVVMAISRDIL